VTVRIGAACCFELVTSKSASTAVGWAMSIEHGPPPEHAPDQELNTDPGAAMGVRFTVEFWKKLNAHCGWQLIPNGVLVTEPIPSPPTVTVNGCSSPKSASTGCGEFMVRVHGLTPAQA